MFFLSYLLNNSQIFINYIFKCLYFYFFQLSKQQSHFCVFILLDSSINLFQIYFFFCDFKNIKLNLDSVMYVFFFFWRKLSNGLIIYFMSLSPVFLKET